MMAKIVQGTSFGNAINYVLNRDEAYIMAIRGIKDGTKSEMAHSFEIQAKLKPLTKPVAHISLNFSAEDKSHLTDEKMIEIAAEYMEKMGYGDTQLLMVRHTDRGHPHLHLILNRIDFKGNRITDQNERIRNQKVCKELTARHGLFVAEGKQNVNRERLRGKERTKYYIYDSLTNRVPNCKSWQELQDKLRQDGIGVAFKYNGSTDEIQGVKFMADNITFNGSKVDKQFSYSKIDYILRQNQREDQREQHARTYVQQPQFTEQNHHSGESLGSAIGSIFDFSDAPADDIDEERFRHAMQKKPKKKRGISR